MTSPTTKAKVGGGDKRQSESAAAIRSACKGSQEILGGGGAEASQWKEQCSDRGAVTADQWRQQRKGCREECVREEGSGGSGS
jgi:hypothetical protein